MVSQTLTDLIRRARALTPEERRQLVAHLVRSGREAEQTPAPPRRAWREIRGAAPCPLVGEDAQTWVSRARREGDEEREQHRHKHAP